MTLRYASVCSGIEAASLAWLSLGWTPAFFAEIEKFPSAVLAHRFGSNMPGRPPAANGVPNLGDFTKIGEGYGPVDLLCGGTPCQSLSIAGKRAGLDDPRGMLTYEFARLAGRLRARWFVWENVPGVLSIDEGRTFGQILAWFAGAAGATGQPDGFVFEPPAGGWQNAGIVAPAGGFGLAWRVLDAQYVRVDSHPRAVPQRRRRVFVVGYLGDWRPAAAVLFEPEGMRGDPAPRREAGQGIAGTLESRASGGGGGPGAGTDGAAAGYLQPVEPDGKSPIDCTPGRITGAVSSKWSKGTGGPAGDEHYNLVAGPVTTRPYADRGDTDANESHLVAHALRGEGFDASEDGTGRGTPLVPVGAAGALTAKGTDEGMGQAAASGLLVPVAFDTTQITSPENGSNPKPGGPCHPLAAGAHPPAIAFSCKDHGADAGELSPSLRAMGHDGSHANAGALAAVAIQERAVSENPDAGPDGAGVRDDGAAYTLEARQTPQAVAFTVSENSNGFAWENDVAPAIDATGGRATNQQYGIRESMAVRRLTPRECERLQGFPDDWTLIPMNRALRRAVDAEMAAYYRRARPELSDDAIRRLAADGPRYKAIGNSWAINAIRWIGQRIDLFEREVRPRTGNGAGGAGP